MTKLRAFADNNLYTAKMTISLCDREENTVGKLFVNQYIYMGDSSVMVRGHIIGYMLSWAGSTSNITSVHTDAGFPGNDFLQ